MAYDFSDLKQSSIGAFMAMIIFLALRGGNPFVFDPTRGLFITAILLVIYYNGYKMKDKFQHFIINLSVTFSISAMLANTFDLVTWSEVLSIDVFGTVVIIAFWVGLVQAMLYDRYNFVSPMNRFYVRGR